MKPERSILEAIVGTAISAALIAGAWQGWLKLDITEVFGFVTGGLSVYLTIRRNIWLWPVGMVNNLFFGLLFWKARLYADLGLQVVYFLLSIIGWYWWLHGGERNSKLPVRHARAVLLILSTVFVAAATFAMKMHLERIGGSSPLWDGLTTALSLAAQYLLTRKYLENWYFWIMADLVYIPLYISKGLHLTAGLYGIFLLMCLAGLTDWKKALKAQQPGSPPDTPSEPITSPS